MYEVNKSIKKKMKIYLPILEHKNKQKFIYTNQDAYDILTNSKKYDWRDKKNSLANTNLELKS